MNLGQNFCFPEVWNPLSKRCTQSIWWVTAVGPRDPTLDWKSCSRGNAPLYLRISVIWFQQPVNVSLNILSLKSSSLGFTSLVLKNGQRNSLLCDIVYLQSTRCDNAVGPLKFIASNLKPKRSLGWAQQDHEFSKLITLFSWGPIPTLSNMKCQDLYLYEAARHCRSGPAHQCIFLRFPLQTVSFLS